MQRWWCREGGKAISGEGGVCMRALRNHYFAYQLAALTPIFNTYDIFLSSNRQTCVPSLSSFAVTAFHRDPAFLRGTGGLFPAQIKHWFRPSLEYLSSTMISVYILRLLGARRIT